MSDQNFTVLVEDSNTQKLASAEGWTFNAAFALVFKHGADAVAYCLDKNLVNVNLIYRHSDNRLFLRVPCFRDDLPVTVVPAPGIPPGASVFGGPRSIN